MNVSLFSPSGPVICVVETKQSLVDIDNMMKLLDVRPTVVDACPETVLEAPRGEVVFDNVTFSYPKGSSAPLFTRKTDEKEEEKNFEAEEDQEERAVLQNISFTVGPGKTLGTCLGSIFPQTGMVEHCWGGY